MMSGFTDEDVKKLQEFGAFLNQKAKFNDMSIPDSVKLITYLQFYNNLASKIEDNILEVKKIHTAKQAEVPSIVKSEPAAKPVKSKKS